MSNQIVKNLTMLALVVGLALAATVVSANGQSRTSLASANIPFDFIVGDKTLPSGKYMVHTATSDGQGVSISSRERKASAIILTLTVAEKTRKRTPRMVFHRYGQQYFLSEVWSGGDYGRQLRPSKRERNLQRELASNGSKSDSSYEIVEVAVLR